MNLQFSIIGYAIIAVFYVISGAILFLMWVRFERKRWIKPFLAIVIPVVLALPWAEEVWIAWNFENLCDGVGVNITRQVEVAGFYNDTVTGPSSPGPITNSQAVGAYESTGFSFVERKTTVAGKISHVARSRDGQWVVTLRDQPSAKYHYVKVFEDKPMAGQISCSEDAILDSSTQSKIASRIFCKRYSNSIEALWLSFLHHGPIEYCPTLQKDLKGMLYHHVLVPTNGTKDK